MQAVRQSVLDFGPVDHFEALHGGHRYPVAVATKAAGDFHQRVYEHDAAAAVLASLAGNYDHATFFSQAGFSKAGGRRTNADVRALTAWFVDLDAYKFQALAGFDADRLLDEALARHPWLPTPTLLVDSGRGAYFVWTFDRPVDADRLDEWQGVEDLLVSILAPLGADPGAKDPARVLRVAGSFHVVAGERVRARRVGDAVRFDAMRALVLRNAPGNASEARPQPQKLRAVEGEGEPRKRAGKGLSTYRLALDRMADYRTLAELRGGDLGDCRHRLLYCYAQAAAWYVDSVERLREELDAFAEDHFRDPSRYRSRLVESVIRRFEDDACGRIVRLPGARDEGRYRFTNAYIRRVLEVTPEEERHLRAIISTAEKRRRETEKRRASGMVPRVQYLDRAAERRSEARRLRCEGLSIREIADRLGVSLDTVKSYFRASSRAGGEV